MAPFSLRYCVIPLRTTWVKEYTLVFIYTKMIQNCLRNGWVIAIFLLRGCVVPFRTIWDKRESFGVYLCQKSKIGQEMAELWPFSPLEVWWFHIDSHETKGDALAFICTKKIQNWSRNGWVTAIHPLRRCVISLRTTWDQRGSFGFSFVPKRSKIGQEMAELWLFFHWEVVWFHWDPQGTTGDPWVFICAKKIQNRSTNGWVMAIFPLGGCVISLRTTCDQRGSSGVHLCRKDPKSVKKWLSYGYFPTERLCDFI